MFNKIISHSKMSKRTIKNTIRNSQVRWWSWSLSVGQQRSHLGNAHWEKIPETGMTEASVKKTKGRQHIQNKIWTQY